jgi:hypothetical protein
MIQKAVRHTTIPCRNPADSLNMQNQHVGVSGHISIDTQGYILKKPLNLLLPMKPHALSPEDHRKIHFITTGRYSTTFLTNFPGDSKSTDPR